MPSTMLLECALNDNDVEAKRSQIVKLLNLVEASDNEIQRLKDRQKSVKATQSEIQGKIAQTRTEINKRAEFREVPISERREKQFVVTVRDDTGDQVSKRRLSPSEKSADNKAQEEDESATDDGDKPRRGRKAKPPKKPRTPRKNKSETKPDGWREADEKAGDDDDDN